MGSRPADATMIDFSMYKPGSALRRAAPIIVAHFAHGSRRTGGGPVRSLRGGRA
jgi:hypothetical protein